MMWFSKSMTNEGGCSIAQHISMRKYLEKQKEIFRNQCQVDVQYKPIDNVVNILKN